MKEWKKGLVGLVVVFAVTGVLSAHAAEVGRLELLKVQPRYTGKQNIELRTSFETFGSTIRNKAKIEAYLVVLGSEIPGNGEVFANWAALETSVIKTYCNNKDILVSGKTYLCTDIRYNAEGILLDEPTTAPRVGWAEVTVKNLDEDKVKHLEINCGDGSAVKPPQSSYVDASLCTYYRLY